MRKSESTVLVFTSLPISLLRSPFRHTGISGERPHGAVSGVGDPRERHALIRVYPLGTIRRSRLANLPRWRSTPLTLAIVPRRPPGVPTRSAGCRPAVAGPADGRLGC